MSEPRAIGLAGLLGSVPPPAIEQRLAEARARGEVSGSDAARAEAERQRRALIAGHQAELADVRDRLETAERSFAATTAAIEQAFAQALADLTLSAARALTGAEPALQAAAIEAIVLELIAAVPDGAVGTLLVPPDTPVVAPDGWRLAVDPALPPGELRADLGTGGLAASLSDRIARLGDSLDAGASE